MKIRNDIDDDFISAGFNDQTDVFARRGLADRLTRLYLGLQQGSVAVLDGRWGIGKSVFARQWKVELEKEGMPCIYFDAFASDYIDNPFRAVASAFVRAAKDAQNLDKPTYNRFLNAAARTAKIVAGPASKIALKALTLGIVGSGEADDLKAMVKEIGDEISDESEEAIKHLFEEQANDDAIFLSLKKSLEDLPALLSLNLEVGNNIENPSLVVIIDGLDRCRPDFALGVIEVLKHFFRANKIHFVLVTNMEHLRLSIKKRYGVEDGASEYLQKFYDFIIPFEDRSESDGPSNASAHAARLLRSLLPGQRSQESINITNAVGSLIDAFDLSLRQAERIVSNIVLSGIDFQKKSFRPAYLVAFLSLIKALNVSLFSDIKNRKLNTEKITDFILTGEFPSESARQNLLQMINYYTLPIISDDDPEFGRFRHQLFDYHFDDRRDILPYLANEVIDNFGGGQR